LRKCFKELLKTLNYGHSSGMPQYADGSAVKAASVRSIALASVNQQPVDFHSSCFPWWRV
jgi:hypothetical protein